MLMPRIYHRNSLSDYEVTRDGNVINRKTGKVLKLQRNGKGYLRFSIFVGEKKKFLFVHRIVAQKYVPNPENKPQVNHIDGDKTNNNADNLEWVSNKENRNHAIIHGLILRGGKCPWSKLRMDDVNYIRNHKEIPRKILSEKYGVSLRTISDIRLGKTWKVN